MPTIPYFNKAGVRVPSTTTCLSQWGEGSEILQHWANKIGRETGKTVRQVLSEAADSGTLAHFMFECLITGVQADPAEIRKYSESQIVAAKNCLENFIHWMEGQKFVTVSAECHLVNEEYQYGSTPDLIGIVRDKLSLVDWKTSNFIGKKMVAQLASYVHNWEHNHPYQPLDGGVYLLRVDKTAERWDWHYWGRNDS
jgi:hypothetical protein